MRTNKKKHSKTQMDSETAIAFAGNEFEKRHPREAWPEWLRSCTVIDYHKDQQNRFVVSFSVSMAEPLQPDEYWEEIEGKRRIVKVIPGSAERFIVSMTPSHSKVYFRAIVDSETAAATVIVDGAISKIVGKELNR